MTTGVILLLVGLGLVFVVGPMLGFNLGFDWLKKDPAPAPMPTQAMADAGQAAAQYAAGPYAAGVRAAGRLGEPPTATGPAPQFLATPQA